MFDKIIHKWLHVPYRLHVRFHQNPLHATATILLLHGIGANGEYWKKLLPRLPQDTQIIAVDLLGFGASPKPQWSKYDARAQTTAVLRTLAGYSLRRPCIIIGHSLGSLIAVELATRRRTLADRLILLAPPFYSSSAQGAPQLRTDRLLRSLYGLMQNYPTQFVRIATFILKTRLLNPAIQISHDSVEIFMAVLRASIVNQTSLQDVAKLRLPIHIIRGAFDPFLVPAHLKRLARSADNIDLTTLPASHELNQRMSTTTLNAVLHALHPSSRPPQ